MLSLDISSEFQIIGPHLQYVPIKAANIFITPVAEEEE